MAKRGQEEAAHGKESFCLDCSKGAARFDATQEDEDAVWLAGAKQSFDDDEVVRVDELNSLRGYAKAIAAEVDESGMAEPEREKEGVEFLHEEEVVQGAHTPEVNLLRSPVLEIEIRRIFDCLRKYGIAPHPWGDTTEDNLAYDADVVAMLATKGPEPITTEQTVTPSARFGLRNPLCLMRKPIDPATAKQGEPEAAWTDPGTEPGAPPDSKGQSARQYGRFCDTMRDMARVGVGVVSHFHHPDLAWYLMSQYRWMWTDPAQWASAWGEEPSEKNPAPTDMITQLTEYNFWAFRAFTLFVVCCHIDDMQAIPVLFDYGGGTRVNEDAGGFGPNKELNKDAIEEGKPSHQTTGFSVPCQHGWDLWYWSGHNAGEVQEKLYQRSR